MELPFHSTRTTVSKFHSTSPAFPRGSCYGNKLSEESKECTTDLLGSNAIFFHISEHPRLARL